MTRSQEKLIALLKEEGEAWVVPCQMRMVRLLAHQGKLRITDERRYDKYKNVHTRRVLPPEKEEVPSDSI